jgi:hypothetical protein
MEGLEQAMINTVQLATCETSLLPQLKQHSLLKCLAESKQVVQPISA